MGRIFGVRRVERVDDFSVNSEASLSDKREWVWNLRTAKKRPRKTSGGNEIRNKPGAAMRYQGSREVGYHDCHADSSTNVISLRRSRLTTLF